MWRMQYVRDSALAFRLFEVEVTAAAVAVPNCMGPCIGVAIREISECCAPPFVVALGTRGLALLAAGLAGDDLRPLPSGTILSCGPAGNASDHRTADADDRGCVPHWRSGSRKDLGEGIAARPIPPLRPAKHFW